jgi:hypothetical protein
VEGARSDVGRREGGRPRLRGARPDGSGAVDAGQAPARCRAHRPVGHPVWRCHGVRRCFMAGLVQLRPPWRGAVDRRAPSVERRASSVTKQTQPPTQPNARRVAPPEHHAQRSWTGQLVRSRAHAAARPTVQSNTCAWPWVTGPFPGPMPRCFNQQPHPRSAAPFGEPWPGEWRRCNTASACACWVLPPPPPPPPPLLLLLLLLLLLRLLGLAPPAADPDGPVGPVDPIDPTDPFVYHDPGACSVASRDSSFSLRSAAEIA